MRTSVNFKEKKTSYTVSIGDDSGCRLEIGGYKYKELMKIRELKKKQKNEGKIIFFNTHYLYLVLKELMNFHHVHCSMMVMYSHRLLFGYCLVLLTMMMTMMMMMMTMMKMMMAMMMMM